MKRATATFARTGVAFGTLCATLLTGCETPLDKAWTLSEREYVARSIANPEAGKGNLEAPRPDGVASDSAVSKHREHERTLRPQRPESVINVQVGS